MRWYEEAFRSKLHALRPEYDLLRPALDLVSRVVDAEVKKVTRSTHRPTLSDSRIKDLDGMRLKYVDLYDAFNARIAECERLGETVSARAARDRLRRFLDDPIPHVHDVIGLRYVTTYSYHDFRRRIAPRFRALQTDDEEAEHWTVDYSPRLPSGEDRREEMAEHLVGRLTDAQIAVAITQGEREGLAVTEDQLRKLPFEIQLRTTVVHAWTVISHEKLYKVSGRTKVAGDMAKLGREVLQIQAAFDRITDEDDLWLDHLMERLARQSTSGEYKFEDLAKRERLLAEPCTDDQALSAYAMYRFYDTSFYGPTNEVSPLWIALCARTLAETGLATIADLDAHVNSVIDEVIAYRDEVRDEHRNIFKDATDWLSKCLIFSLPEFQRHYPYGEQTKRELIRLGKLADHPGRVAP